MANKIENKPPVKIVQKSRVKPDWLKVDIAGGGKYSEIEKSREKNTDFTPFVKVGNAQILESAGV